MASKPKATPRRVDFANNREDRLARDLASLGYSRKFIEEEIKRRVKQRSLTQGQIYYRMRAAEVKLSDYRNGNSDVAREVLEQNLSIADRVFVRLLRRSSK